MLVLAKGVEVELMWSGNWIYLGSMSSIFLVSLLFDWLLVHQNLGLIFDVTCSMFT